MSKQRYLIREVVNGWIIEPNIFNQAEDIIADSDTQLLELLSSKIESVRAQEYMKAPMDYPKDSNAKS